MSRSLLALLALCAACSDGTNLLGRTSIDIDSPQDGSSVFSLEPFAFQARASGNTNIGAVVLRVGTVEVKRCPGNTTGDEITCSAEIDSRDYAGQIASGQLKVTAAAVLEDDEKTAEATVAVKPIRVAFKSPAGSEPVLVHGTSSLELEVQSEVPVEGDVVITADNGIPIRSLAAAPYQRDLEWSALLDPGEHTLQATATDTQQRSDTARLRIRVGCDRDGECESTQKCCTSTHACVAKTATCG